MNSQQQELNKKEKILGGIKYVEKTETKYFIKFETGEEARLKIYDDHIFRFHMSPDGKFLEFPAPINPNDDARIAKDVAEFGFETHLQSQFDDFSDYFIIKTKKIQIVFDKIKGIMKVHDARVDKDVIIEAEPLMYTSEYTTQTLHQRHDEYFFGGGMQNGRFSHKGKVIEIANTNVWTDGGVTSPCPFYWSSYGYGILRNTWQKGLYDFGDKSEGFIKTSHRETVFDALFFINSQPKDILRDYFKLTGIQFLLPEYAYYEAHLNAFNRDYWVEVPSDTPGGIKFEDKKYYKCYKPEELGDKNGILESLNGEKNNYQFSARAMVDRYKELDVPLGWFIPNDGYGSGYGQTDSFDGDIQNLKEFVDYAKSNGVEVALWTESNLHPADPLHPKKGERDLSKEISVCKVVALKCDVKWIGSGYSSGLSAIKDACDIFITETKYGIRPLIITVDGWAGTHRYAGVWTGDQEGGKWEYIRFHIPTYIGSGLSGLPIVGSDMDGIFGGDKKNVNVRDFQWKAFTPIQLNMDGWGNMPKTPFSWDDETTELNRAYLKLKSMLMPYNYALGYEAINGLPMIRAMFLEYPNEIPAYTNDSQYQYMWGPNLLIAPIYNDPYDTRYSVRDGIYLPDKNQVWIDFFVGQKYKGGKIYNNIVMPLWRLPVFVKDGSIIPMTNPNNNPNQIERDKRTFVLYPNGETSFEVYEDDGISMDYTESHFAKTNVLINGPKTNEVGNLLITIHKTIGLYSNMVKERSTTLKIMASSEADSISVIINGEVIEISKSKSLTELENNDLSYYFDEKHILNPYLSKYKNGMQKFLIIRIGPVDVTFSEIVLKIRGFVNKGKIFGDVTVENDIIPPSMFEWDEEKTTWCNIALKWKPVNTADYYEIERDEVIFSNITKNLFTFEGFKCNTKHNFRIRSVTKERCSEWSNNLEVLTKEDPFKQVIFGVKITCNIPCQPSQEVCKLTDGNFKTMWHTDWGTKGKAVREEGKFLKLFCDLGDIYELDKISYLPREDAGNGTFLEVQYRHSVDSQEWCPISKPFLFSHDNTIKTIPLKGERLRFFELTILNTIGDFGSGRQMLFYKK